MDWRERERRRKKKYNMLGWLLIIGVATVLFGAPTIAYRMSAETVTFTVETKERVVDRSGENITSKYMVFADNEVFKVVDTWSFLRWDSSDRYRNLKEGQTYTAKVAGWRVPFLSWYRNIVEVRNE